MLTRWASRHICCHVDIRRTQHAVRRKYATASAVADRTRNIGIIAHIDAGKTTTTERMLYYAGYTRQIGDVDEGSTITDFLPAERARGITIQSAAISFSWPPAGEQVSAKLSADAPRASIPHNINLIDTPGHADFTFEVLRSLRVLDGAVCILDSVAGVEAQTEKVWAQASTYHIPRLIFVNKLDRDGASFSQTVQEVGAKLNVWPAVCMVPWWDDKGALIGVGDAINLRALKYATGGDGKNIQLSDIPTLQQEDAAFAETITQARVALVELLAEHDEQMVEIFLDSDEDHLKVSSQDIKESLRRCTLHAPQRLAPVFAGASFRNVGVQPLLDGIVDLLPSPLERPDAEVSLGTDTSRQSLPTFLDTKLETGSTKNKSLSKQRATTALQVVEACALAFKVVNDPRRGILVYVRAYHGRIVRNALLWNTNLQVNERAQRLLKMYANDAVDIDDIEAGQIGVIPGLKFARTGDSLIAYQGANPKSGPPSPVSQLQLRPIEVPPPVFFVSVEPNSLAEERHVKESLELLLREDPSLNVRVDEESGQTHLAGMGELHLEIARDRLVQDLKAKARVGNIEISYREAMSVPSSEISELYEKDISGKSSKAGCLASVLPRDGTSALPPGTAVLLSDNNILVVSMPAIEKQSQTAEDDNTAWSEATVIAALQNGVLAALARGPSFGYPVHSTVVHLTIDPTKHIFSNTTTTALSSVARTAVQKALRDSAAKQESALMEPVMRVAISVDEPSLGSVVQDISAARGGNVLALDSDDLDESSSGLPLDKVDIRRVYTPPDPFGSSGMANNLSTNSTSVRTIIARVPLKEMVGYLKHLRSLTGGRGTFTMLVDQFERMGSQRVKAMMSGLAGDNMST